MGKVGEQYSFIALNTSAAQILKWYLICLPQESKKKISNMNELNSKIWLWVHQFCVGERTMENNFNWMGNNGNGIEPHIKVHIYCGRIIIKQNCYQVPYSMEYTPYIYSFHMPCITVIALCAVNWMGNNNDGTLGSVLGYSGRFHLQSTLFAVPFRLPVQL